MSLQHASNTSPSSRALHRLCLTAVSDVITRHGLDYHQFADDTHLFLAVSVATIQFDLSAVEICSSAVKL